MVPIPEIRRLNEYTGMAESEVRRAFPNLKYDGSMQNIYDLYRPLQGTLKPYLNGKLMFMPDASDFIHNALKQLQLRLVVLRGNKNGEPEMSSP